MKDVISKKEVLNKVNEILETYNHEIRKEFYDYLVTFIESRNVHEKWKLSISESEELIDKIIDSVGKDFVPFFELIKEKDIYREIENLLDELDY